MINVQERNRKPINVYTKEAQQKISMKSEKKFNFPNLT